MKVREFIEWLSSFEDQEAEVRVVDYTAGTGYYDQGGRAIEVLFDPLAHAEYTDLRGNQFIKPDELHFGWRSLLLGVIDR